MSVVDMHDPAALAHEYMSIQSKIKELMAEGDRLKDNLVSLIPKDQPQTYGTVRVEWVKGRHTERTDTKVLKTALVLAGVTEDVLAPAFAKATKISEGEPHLRISKTDTVWADEAGVA